MLWNETPRVLFETPEGGAGGGEPPAADPTPAAAEATPATPAAGEEQPFSVSQEDWQRLTGTLEQWGPIIGTVAELLQPEPEPQQQPYFDPNDPNSIDGFVNQRVEQMLEERLGPFQPMLGQIAEREGEQYARSTLDQLAQDPQIGEFNRDQALLLTQGLLAQQVPPMEALRLAAAAQAQFEKQYAEQAVEAYKKSLTPAATAAGRGDLALSPAAAAATELAATPTGENRYEDALARAMSAMNPELP